MFFDLVTLALLSMPVGGAHRIPARPPLRPVFGRALPWGAAQPKQEVRAAKRSCSRLRGRTLPPTARELARSRPIPEWPMLRWGMEVDRVRGALAKAGWPARIYCLPKPGTPNLKLLRLWAARVPGTRIGPWKATLFFRPYYPTGLFGILMERKTHLGPRQEYLFQKAVLRAYGATARRIKHSTRRTVYKEFVWMRPEAKIRLVMRRFRKTGLLEIAFRYRPFK